MNLFLIKILTLKKLGFLNAIHVLNYRIKIKFGISSACKKKKKLNLPNCEEIAKFGLDIPSGVSLKKKNIIFIELLFVRKLF